MRKKISIGFMCLAFMLAFSGMVSLIELNRLSKNTQDFLTSSSENMELSKVLLDAVQDQNASVLQMILSGSELPDSTYYSSTQLFEETLESINTSIEDRAELDKIYLSYRDYSRLVKDYINGPELSDFEWFANVYRTSYSDLTSAIKNYMTGSQYSIVSRTNQLKSTAYRAITPGIITLCVAILMVILLAYFIDRFYSRPITRLHASMEDHLLSGKPLKINPGGTDEVAAINEQISTLYGNKNTRR